jgi:hypothetical protein
MGQFALGIRSLLVRATIFVVLAALLAWALGGTLFPKPHAAEFRAQSAQFSDETWYWRVLVGGKNKGEVRWNLMRQPSESAARVAEETDYIEVAGPVLGSDGSLYYAGRVHDSPREWQIICRDGAGAIHTHAMPDRLAVEQQLGRIQAGLTLQDSSAILQQRARVLDPSPDPVDE